VEHLDLRRQIDLVTYFLGASHDSKIEYVSAFIVLIVYCSLINYLQVSLIRSLSIAILEWAMIKVKSTE
jgi:hypothetical protein